MKLFLTMFFAWCAATVLAGPAVKIDPVADAYPDWQGITAKGYISGREICPSDLRHKVTIVVEVEPNDKLMEQLASFRSLTMRTGFSSTLTVGANWEDAELPRNVILLVSVRGGAKHAIITDILSSYRNIKDQETQSAISSLGGNGCSFYDDVTFTGAPDTTGKRPFVYVMGPTGRTPLFQGALNAEGIKGAIDAIEKGKKEIAAWNPQWRPYFGNIEEPKYHPLFAKTLEKAKHAKLAPLDALAKSLLADVKAKETEKANEAQVLYDALNQTRSDLTLRIQMEAATCPHRACWDILTLSKYWPSEKKRVEAVAAKIKANPEADALAKIFCKAMEWEDPDFTCKSAADAKKIVVELNKMKKTLEKLKESKANVIQNGASLLGMKIDDLITSVPSKVAEK